MGVSKQTALKPGTRVLVPWGLNDPREAVVIEVWGDPQAPTHIRIQLVVQSDEDEAGVLLLNPQLVTLAS